VRILAIRAYSDGRVHGPGIFDSRDPIRIALRYRVLQPTKRLAAGVWLSNDEGVTVFSTVDQHVHGRLGERGPGLYESVVTIPGNFLTEGTFFVKAVVLGLQAPLLKHVREPDAVSFQVL